MVSGHVAKGKMKMLTIEARKAEKIEKILKDVKSFIGCKRDIDILQCVYIDEKGISVNNCQTAITRLWDASVIVKGKGHALIPFEFLLYLLGGFKTFKGTKLHGLKGQRVKITVTPIVYKPNEYHKGHVVAESIPRLTIESGKFTAKLICVNPCDYPEVRITNGEIENE